ncbi:hypothetical protein [[Mycoplasma] collis]|uniref:hypothetical protein n=1 Tax=[Mycoplasma] collis TaxID=2127 RepID=UPI00051ADBB1|nr:hypothetical protein [[Mycoplasma] collis]
MRKIEKFKNFKYKGYKLLIILLFPLFLYLLITFILCLYLYLNILDYPFLNFFIKNIWLFFCIPLAIFLARIFTYVSFFVHLNYFSKIIKEKGIITMNDVAEKFHSKKLLNILLRISINLDVIDSDIYLFYESNDSFWNKVK